MTPARRLMFSSEPAGVSLEAFELSDPKPSQILVQNSHTQVSAGSESNFLRHGPTSYGLPPGPAKANIGYMATGRIIALGSEVKRLAIGDRIVTTSSHASHCLVDVGHPTALDPIPNGVPDTVAGFAVLGDVALHAVRRAALQIDQSVAIFGMGMVGQLVLQLARASGAYPLIAIDLSDERLELSRLSGATHVIHAAREDVVKRIKELTGGKGCETVFHCAQAATILQTTMECAADRGSVILTGSPAGTATIRLKEELLRKELRVTGTYESGMNDVHAYWGWTRERNRRSCLRLMGTGQLSLEHLMTHVVPAEEAPQVYETILAGTTGWLGIAFSW